MAETNTARKNQNVFECVFTVGKHTKVEGGVLRQQDGSITSILIGILVTACFYGLASSRYITTDASRVIKEENLLIGLSVLFILNTCGHISFFSKSGTKR